MKASRASLFALVLLVLGASAASQWWSHRQEAGLGQALAALAAPGDLRMLSSDTCSICLLARQWLTQHRVAYTECSIERDAACRAEYDALQAPGTPVFIVRGQPELGFRPERLRERLTRAG